MQVIVCECVFVFSIVLNLRSSPTLIISFFFIVAYKFELPAPVEVVAAAMSCVLNKATR